MLRHRLQRHTAGKRKNVNNRNNLNIYTVCLDSALYSILESFSFMEHLCINERNDYRCSKAMVWAIPTGTKEVLLEISACPGGACYSFCVSMAIRASLYLILPTSALFLLIRLAISTQRKGHDEYKRYSHQEVTRQDR